MVILKRDITSTSILSLSISAFLVRLHHGINFALVGAMIKVVQRLQDCILTLQNPAAEPPWKHLGELLAHMGSSWDSEDVVEFFESALLCIWHPEEDHNQLGDISSSVEAEDTCGAHGVEHERKEHRQDTGPEKAHSDSLARSYLTMGKRKDLSRVCKRDRSFSRRVEHGEDVDKHRHQRQVSCLVSFSGRLWRTL